MPRPPVPAFIADLFADPTARSGLLAGSVALFAAALDPKVWGPSLPTVQSAIRDRPNLEAVVILAMVAGSAVLLLGGAVGDTARARPIIVGGLAVELLAGIVSVLVPAGPIFVASRFVGHGAAALVIPASLALVATSYQGIYRATAIGLAYGAYGAAGAGAPILLQLIPDQRWPAFLVAIAACAAALWFVRRRIPELTRPTAPERPYVVGTALWAFGVITATVGVTWFSTTWNDPLRLGLIAVGIAVLGLALAHDRRHQPSPGGAVRIDRRPAAAAIFIGVVLGIAQTAAFLQLPLYFRFVLGFGPVFAVVALAPLILALVLAGPVAGILLSRYSPRWLIGTGAALVGVANLVLLLTATRSTDYLAFVVPLFLIGASYVVATTVRTAVIFASVPRGLPATAAALNETSISVGSRIGIVLVTAVVAQYAIDAYAASVAGLPAAEAERALAAFREVLVAVGTPAFNQVVAGLQGVDVAPYLDAYLAGLHAALWLCGLVAVVGGAVAWALIGRRGALTTVYDHVDERTPAAG
ncbi:MAG TPA: MFS transporter [Candidatus Limnocylindrales bacterium]|nr:MFS transporter [Candidatus Limnocylindrales bacterium]